MQKKYIKLIINAAFLALLILLLWQYASPAQLLLILQQIPGSYIVSGISLLILTYLLRAHRFFLLLEDHNVSWLGVLKIMLQHNAINNVLPFRLGELSFPVLLKKQESIHYQTSVKVLLTARLFDFMIMGGIAFAVFNILLINISLFWVAVEAGLILLSIILIALSRRFHPLPYSEFISGHLSYLKQHFRRVSTTSILIWTLKIAGQALLLAPMLQTKWIYALLAILIVEGTAILPINGPLNFGSLEGASIAILTPLGLTAETILAAILNLHLAIIMLAALGYMLSLLIPGPVQKEVSS